MQLYAILGLVGWAIVGPLLGWGLTDLKHKWVDTPNAVAAAVRQTADASAQECRAKVAKIQTDLEEANREARRLAEEAEQSVGPTPVEKAALQDLCNKSASCRDRELEVKP